jgi:hypothetical protein
LDDGVVPPGRKEKIITTPLSMGFEEKSKGNVA